MQHIIKLQNDLIDLPLRNFTASEMDLLLALCHECQNMMTKTITIDFKTIEKLSGYKNKNRVQFIKDLTSMNSKLMSLNFTITEKNKIYQFVLFPTFITDIEDKTLTIGVHENFVYLLNNLQSRYTTLELMQSVSLKSGYSKAIYKKLREYNNSQSPFWRISINDFRTYLDVPKSYKTEQIDSRIIKPSIQELSHFFSDLTYEKYTEKSKKGRPHIAGFVFHWNNPIYNNTKQTSQYENALDQDIISKITGWEGTPRFCPNCRRKIYKKYISNEFGEYWMYGHPDFKTGPCDFWTNDYANLAIEQNVLLPLLDEEPKKKSVSELSKKKPSEITKEEKHLEDVGKKLEEKDYDQENSADLAKFRLEVDTYMKKNNIKDRTEAIVSMMKERFSQ